MTSEPIEDVLFASDKFRLLLTALTRHAVRADLRSIEPVEEEEATDWNYALFACSALTAATSHRAQEAALRIAQSCLEAPESGQTQREAAAVMLERLGNRQAVALAEGRRLLGETYWTNSPAPMWLDVIRRRLELTIPTRVGASISGSAFQRQFWTAVSEAKWVSVSAPTSAGKSYIVRRWFEDRAGSEGAFRGIYIVPTRALIEEVSNDLRNEFQTSLRVHTLPWDSDIGSGDREVFVLTQERLHLLQQRKRDFSAELLFIDEAQKFDDGPRGVLLQQVLDEAVRRAPQAQVIFASPLASNPELLLSGAPAGADSRALLSDTVTVNQNLLWANQVPNRPMRWTLAAVRDAVAHPVGHFTLTARPSPKGKRLALVAVALAGDSVGNVVYVNKAADAEKTSLQIHDALGPGASLSDNEDIQALRELVVTAIHPQYALAQVVDRGVAFHYGNMPLLVKTEIERLFKAGIIRYLVCTSTLLEGVNLPCRNIFVRGPRRGVKNIMSLSDFWNLAGRAGRWGKEFQGNIVCVDTDEAALWPDRPTVREAAPLRRAADRVMADSEALVAFAEQSPTQTRDLTVEAMFSLLSARIAEGVALSSVTGLTATEQTLSRLESVIAAAIEPVEVPAQLLSRHAGISAMSMQRLLEEFRSRSDALGLVLPLPESTDASKAYLRGLALTDRHLGSGFGTPGRHFQLAILIVSWMRGIPLPQLIDERLRFVRRTQENPNIAATIRKVMEDVEQVVRFQAPKYLACYSDVLRVRANEVGIGDELFEIDVSMMLELGVSRPTEVSLMALGLSRTSAIALSEFIVADRLTPAECVTWIQERDITALGLPGLVVRELLSRVGTQESA